MRREAAGAEAGIPRGRRWEARRNPRSPPMIPHGTISEILVHKGSAAWSIGPDATVFEAIQLMSGKNVGALLVTDGDKLVGIVSERDYTRKVALRGRTSKELKVREILSEKLIHVTPKHTVEECLRLMTEQRIRHLPVLEGEKIAGVVSIGDLVNWVITAQSTTIRQLETYITGYPS
jgi:CBS domain-containing protein